MPEAVDSGPIADKIKIIIPPVAAQLLTDEERATVPSETQDRLMELRRNWVVDTDIPSDLMMIKDHIRRLEKDSTTFADDRLIAAWKTYGRLEEKLKYSQGDLEHPDKWDDHDIDFVYQTIKAEKQKEYYEEISYKIPTWREPAEAEPFEPISQEEAYTLINVALEDTPIKFTKETLNRLWDFTGGDRWAIRLIVHEVLSPYLVFHIPDIVDYTLEAKGKHNKGIEDILALPITNTGHPLEWVKVIRQNSCWSALDFDERLAVLHLAAADGRQSDVSKVSEAHRKSLVEKGFIRIEGNNIKFNGGLQDSIMEDLIDRLGFLSLDYKQMTPEEKALIDLLVEANKNGLDVLKEGIGLTEANKDVAASLLHKKVVEIRGKMGRETIIFSKPIEALAMTYSYMKEKE